MGSLSSPCCNPLKKSMFRSLKWPSRLREELKARHQRALEKKEKVIVDINVLLRPFPLSTSTSTVMLTIKVRGRVRGVLSVRDLPILLMSIRVID